MAEGYWIGPYGILVSNDLLLTQGSKENTLVDKTGKATGFASFDTNEKTHESSRTLSEQEYKNKYAEFYPQTNKWYVRGLTPNIVERAREPVKIEPYDGPEFRCGTGGNGDDEDWCDD